MMKKNRSCSSSIAREWTIAQCAAECWFSSVSHVHCPSALCWAFKRGIDPLSASSKYKHPCSPACSHGCRGLCQQAHGKCLDGLQREWSAQHAIGPAESPLLVVVSSHCQCAVAVAVRIVLSHEVHVRRSNLSRLKTCMTSRCGPSRVHAHA